MKQGKKQTKAASKKSKSARKKASKTTYDQTAGLDYREAPPTMRFSATIHALEQAADPSRIETLNIDRVPDPTGLVRALVTPEDCVRLVNQGFEVRSPASASRAASESRVDRK